MSYKLSVWSSLPFKQNLPAMHSKNWQLKQGNWIYESSSGLIEIEASRRIKPYQLPPQLSRLLPSIRYCLNAYWVSHNEKIDQCPVFLQTLTQINQELDGILIDPQTHTLCYQKQRYALENTDYKQQLDGWLRQTRQKLGLL